MFKFFLLISPVHLKPLPLVALILLPLCLIQGCTPSADLLTTNQIDPAGGMTRQDYLALRNRTPEAPEADNKSPPPIPDLPSNEETSSAGNNAMMDKLVSIDVTDSVSVREVLMELVHKTGANVELDPRVQGSVIITAHNQPFSQVLKRICSMAGLRFRNKGSFIHIEPDDPYQKSYRLDYLSLARKTASDTSIATNVFDVDVTSNGSSSTSSSSSNSGNSTSTQNNSTAKVSSHSEADFWSETEKSVAQILGVGDHKQGTKVNYSINKQAGIVTIYGDERQQEAIGKYFETLKRKAYAQVLIDARIIEVELNDGFQSGIDWAAVFNNAGAIATNFGPQAAVNDPGFFTASVTGTNFAGLLNLVESFGTTRVLSAPRVTVLNNQTAVMKVATNQVYFVTQAQFTTTTNANGSSVTTNPIYTSTPRTVPVGLVMTVQPSIDASTNRVTMTLRPTISRVVGQVNDPSISLNAAVAGVSSPVQSQIPVLAVRELDSVIELHSGEIAVMGGLMQDSSLNTDKGIPGLDDISYIGNLFKSRDNSGKTSELVILLRATISDQPRPDKADNNLYHYYNRDPRPLNTPDLNPRLTPDENNLDKDSDPTL